MRCVGLLQMTDTQTTRVKSTQLFASKFNNLDENFLEDINCVTQLGDPNGSVSTNKIKDVIKNITPTSAPRSYGFTGESWPIFKKKQTNLENIFQENGKEGTLSKLQN